MFSIPICLIFRHCRKGDRDIAWPTSCKSKRHKQQRFGLLLKSKLEAQLSEQWTHLLETIRLSFNSSVIECFGDMLHQLPVNEIRCIRIFQHHPKAPFPTIHPQFFPLVWSSPWQGFGKAFLSCNFKSHASALLPENVHQDATWRLNECSETIPPRDCRAVALERGKSSAVSGRHALPNLWSFQLSSFA